MPQIWMSYEEMAGMLDCAGMQARERVHFDVSIARAAAIERIRSMGFRDRLLGK